MFFPDERDHGRRWDPAREYEEECADWFFEDPLHTAPYSNRTGKLGTEWKSLDTLPPELAPKFRGPLPRPVAEPLSPASGLQFHRSLQDVSYISCLRLQLSSLFPTVFLL